ncbi:carbohydrate ABC transporter permease [Histidinibacterium aquaticum]|uniref:Carbohydrate ABC transporter permease n=1 Tax=Histidinibacterium aquaticum TaxID=2613962 RepID=A0A5J5GQ30_9RHOB|nr:carbohydrate ABC transporter permease [Histidinibacterium aquaticum]KAA9010351.1 carbohydrate ABC transporter permease [Histidinibacterium aquaticum]
MATRNRTPLERVEEAIILSVLIAIVVVTVQPILNLLAISLSDPARVPGMSGMAITPDGFSVDIWKLLANHPAVQRGLMNSLFITSVGTVLNVTCTALMAWALSRKRLPFRRTLFVLILATIVFEPGIIPDYFVMRRLGLLDTYSAVIIYKMVNAWYLIILIRFFEEVPEELIEAAKLDGANAFQTFWRVVVPLAKPALATITLFYVVYHWNEFLRPMIYFNDQDMWPLQVVLRQFVVVGDKAAIVGLQAMNNYEGASQIDFKAFRAGMILFTILPVLAIYPLILRYFTKGTMSGALK